MVSRGHCACGTAGTKPTDRQAALQLMQLIACVIECVSDVENIGIIHFRFGHTIY